MAATVLSARTFPAEMDMPCAEFLPSGLLTEEESRPAEGPNDGKQAHQAETVRSGKLEVPGCGRDTGEGMVVAGWRSQRSIYRCCRKRCLADGPCRFLSRSPWLGIGNADGGNGGYTGNRFKF